MKFKKGDRIQLTQSYCGAQKGATGVVLRKEDDDYAIKFDKFSTRLHDLCGMCKSGHGYWVDEVNMILIDDGDLVAPIKVPKEKTNNLTF